MSSEMELYDAQTGQTTKIKANQCTEVAPKGFKLMGKPDQAAFGVQGHPQEPQENMSLEVTAQHIKLHEDRQQIWSSSAVTRRYFLRPRKNGVVSASDATAQSTGSQGKDISKLRNSPHGALRDGMQPEDVQVAGPVADDRLRAFARTQQPKAIQISGPSLSLSLGTIARTSTATSTKKQKNKLNAWLKLENRLRRAQGKGPITSRRAHTVDARGCYM